MKARTILFKTAQTLLIFFLVVTVNFFIARFMPGDVMMHLLGEEEYTRLMSESPEVIEILRAKYGLDQPLGVQYLRYVKSALRLDFGNSYTTKEPVTHRVFYAMKWTLLLAVPSIVLSALLGGVLGILAGWRQGGKLDQIATPFFILLSAIPSNCVSMLFLLFFAVKHRIFPIGGMTTGGLEGLARSVDILWHMAMPLMIMVLFRTGGNYINMRSYSISIHSEDYITTAVSKGLPGRRVLFRHGLRNIILPYITLLGMQFGGILSGSMMLEVVFSWKGMGQLTYSAAMSRDFPTLQFALLLSSACVLLFNLLADVLCMFIDPRLRGGGVHE